jgi:hypothetical protein
VLQPDQTGKILIRRIFAIRSRRIRGMGHVACIERRIMHSGLWLENIKERGCLKGVGISWRIILKSVRKN